MNIKTIADLAGVSTSTVSRVINQTAKVSQEKRKKVEKVLAETGYRPNILARDIQQNKTHTIGVLFNVEDLAISSLSETLHVIEDQLKKEGYQMMLANARYEGQREVEILQLFQGKRLDGVLYFSSDMTAGIKSLLLQYPIPLVLIGQRWEAVNRPYLIHDDFKAAKMAVDYLIGQGHGKVAYISCPLSDPSAGNERLMGVKKGLLDHGISPVKAWFEWGDFSIESGYQAMKRIWQAKDKPTAVFAGTDYMAIGAMRYLLDRGCHIPGDVSVMGFDDIQVSSYLNPPLTTIHTNKERIGQKAVTTLLQVIKGEPVTKGQSVSFQLIERKSVRSLDKLYR